MIDTTATEPDPLAVDLDDADGPDRPRPGGAGASMARGSVINLAGSAVYGVAGFALIVVVTRQLGSRGAGALFEAIAVFSIVTRSAMAGTDVALVRFTSRFLTRDRADEVRRLYLIALVPVLAISALAGLAVFLLADPLGRVLTTGDQEATLAEYLRVLAPFIPVAAVYQAVDGASRGFGSMLPSVVVERTARAVALPILVGLAIAAGGGATAIGVAWAAPYAVALVPLGVWTSVLLRRAEAAVRGSERVALGDRTLARRFWGFALPRSFAGVFALTITWVDTLILGAIAGTGAVGVYQAAIRWLVVGNIAGQAVTTAFAPQIARVLAEEDGDDARTLFQEAAALLVLLAWPAYLTAMVFAPYLLTAFGEGFGGGAEVIVITGAGFLLASATGPIDMLLLMAGRSRLSLINTGVALVANVGANLILIPPYGVRGAALAWTFSLIVANGLPLVQMWRILGVHPFGARTVRTVALGAGVGAALVACLSVVVPCAAGLAVGLALGATVLLAGIWSSPDHLGVDHLVRRTP